jgi:hypothetical protein
MKKQSPYSPTLYIINKTSTIQLYQTSPKLYIQKSTFNPISLSAHQTKTQELLTLLANKSSGST